MLCDRILTQCKADFRPNPLAKDDTSLVKDLILHIKFGTIQEVGETEDGRPRSCITQLAQTTGGYPIVLDDILYDDLARNNFWGTLLGINYTLAYHGLEKFDLKGYVVYGLRKTNNQPVFGRRSNLCKNALELRDSLSSLSDIYHSCSRCLRSLQCNICSNPPRVVLCFDKAKWDEPHAMRKDHDKMNNFVHIGHYEREQAARLASISLRAIKQYMDILEVSRPLNSLAWSGGIEHLQPPNVINPPAVENPKTNAMWKTTTMMTTTMGTSQTTMMNVMTITIPITNRPWTKTAEQAATTIKVLIPVKLSNPTIPPWSSKLEVSSQARKEVKRRKGIGLEQR